MIKANITMKDGTELKEVLLFKTKGLGDSEITSKGYAILTLKGENPSLKQVYIGNKYIQGAIIPQQIESYELIDNDKEVREFLLNFIQKDNMTYDLDSSVVTDFIIDNRENLLEILK